MPIGTYEVINCPLYVVSMTWSLSLFMGFPLTHVQPSELTSAYHIFTVSISSLQESNAFSAVCLG